MAEIAVKSKKEHKILKRVLAGLFSLFLMALVYVAAVLLQSPADNREGSFVVEDEPEAVTRMQAAAMNDAAALSRLFGAPLPALPSLTPNGQGENAAHDGQTVRKATLTYDGLVITAVRPASAAPLLLLSGLSVSLKSDLTVLNLPAVLCGRGSQRCVYMSNESAAYSIYAPNCSEDDFLALLERLVWVQ